MTTHLSLPIEDNPLLQGLLATALSQGNPLEILEEQILTSASSLAFLAITIKDQGAAKSAGILLKKALELVPNYPTYALNYVHILELFDDYDQAFQETVSSSSSNSRFC